MGRYDYEEDYESGYGFNVGDDADEDQEYVDDEGYEDEEDDDDEDTIPPRAHDSGEHDLEISMEVDEEGNEVWFAEDSKVPGSSSIGHSLEEAMDGVDERRKAYRDMLRKSREKRERRERGEE